MIQFVGMEVLVLESKSYTTTESMRYAVRPMTPADLHQITDIEQDSFPEIWPPTKFGKELQNNLSRYLVVADTKTTIESPSNVEQIVPDKPWVKKLPLIRRFLSDSPPVTPTTDLLVGYVGLWFMIDEAHITSIAVRSSHRGHGIGELLIIASLELGEIQDTKMLTLETRISNVIAQNLYKKYGLAIVGKRKDYYSDNNEDAYIMSTGNTKTEEYKDFFNNLRRKHSEQWGVSFRYITD
jgi:ribosomal-protein-alanine N-acetyltransferase